MSIQDPTPDPRQAPYGQQPGSTSSSSAGYNPVAEPSAQNPAGHVPPVDPFAYQGSAYPNVPLPGAPNPGLAALLGFIPGVGAMYNGQFPKGIAHIAIFAVFSSLSKNVNGIFGLFVAGWIFYMVFEAYQTARARRDGLPLPDPFGLNNVGERFGFRGNPDFSSFWSHGTPPPSAPPAGEAHVDPITGAASYPRTDAAGASTSYQVDPSGNVFRSAPAPGYPAGTAPGFGYVPPVPPAAGSSAPAAGYPTYGPQPPVYGAPPYSAAPFGVPPMPPMPPVPRNGLPTGALWLIGLGFFALLGSMRSFEFLEGEATGGLFLIGLSFFLLWRRYSVNKSLYPDGSPAAGWNILRASRGAAVLFAVGLLTLLQGLHVIDWQSSWPFLLIFLGVFILLERLVLNRVNAPAYPTGYGPPPGTASQTPETSPVETSSPTSIVPKYTRPSNDIDNTEGR